MKSSLYGQSFNKLYNAIRTAYNNCTIFKWWVEKALLAIEN